MAQKLAVIKILMLESPLNGKVSIQQGKSTFKVNYFGSKYSILLHEMENELKHSIVAVYTTGIFNSAVHITIKSPVQYTVVLD